jgi:hypothetical protein
MRQVTSRIVCTWPHNPAQCLINDIHLLALVQLPIANRSSTTLLVTHLALFSIAFHTFFINSAAMSSSMQPSASVTVSLQDVLLSQIRDCFNDIPEDVMAGTQRTWASANWWARTFVRQVVSR